MNRRVIQGGHPFLEWVLNDWRYRAAGGRHSRRTAPETPHPAQDAAGQTGPAGGDNAARADGQSDGARGELAALHRTGGYALPMDRPLHRQRARGLRHGDRTVRPRGGGIEEPLIDVSGL